MKISKSMQESYGTMTNVEKNMNKQDLKAYKAFDSRQYSLIPGIQHQKPGTLSPQKDLNRSALRQTSDIFGAASLNKSYDFINGRSSRGDNGHSSLAARGGYLPSVRDYAIPSDQH